MLTHAYVHHNDDERSKPFMKHLKGGARCPKFTKISNINTCMYMICLIGRVSVNPPMAYSTRSLVICFYQHVATLAC